MGKNNAAKSVRLSYRLSKSQYRDNFCLKGSALLFAYEKFKVRPTN